MKEKEGEIEKNLKQIIQELNITIIKIEHKKEMLKLCNNLFFWLTERLSTKTKMKYNFETKLN